MGWVRRAGILLTVLVIAFAAAGAVAGAKKHKKKGKPWASQVTLTKSSSTRFDGAVSSKLQACRSSRVITLFYTDPNSGLTSLLSVQRTDGDGRYRVILPTPAYAGTYQALVSPRKIRALKAPQTCRDATSQAVTV